AIRSTRRRPLMEDLESRVVMSTNYVYSGTSKADAFLVRRNPNDPTSLQVKLNGSVLLNAPLVAGDTLKLNGLDGDDTFTIEDTFAGVPVTLKGGNDNDTAEISKTAQFLDNIDGAVSFDGGGGTDTDTLNIYDQKDTFNDTYTETSSYVERNASAMI